jgi:hypothetical protein
MILGVNCKLFSNTASYSTPTWVERKNVMDVKLPIDADEAEATTRGMNGWKALEPAILAAGVEFTSIWETTDAWITALVTAFFAKSSLDIAVLDGPSSGGSPASQGLRAVMKVFKFERGEPIDGVATIDFGIKPCYNPANPPAWQTFT